MSACAFIGDEVTAAGFRLAGVEVHVPEPEDTEESFRRVRDDCSLLLLTAEAARRIAPALLTQTVEQGAPLLLVVPDAAGRLQPLDLEAELRRQLGMSE